MFGIFCRKYKKEALDLREYLDQTMNANRALNAEIDRLEREVRNLKKALRSSRETSPRIAKMASTILDKKVTRWEQLKVITSLKDIKSIAASALAQVGDDD